MTPAMKFWPALLLLGAFTVFIQCRPEDTAPFVPELRFPIDISKDETEANSTFEFPLVLNQSTTRDIVVHYETRELTALEGEDYIPVADSLVIPAGTASASIFVDIVVDDYLEEDEQFRVVLTGSTNAILAGGIQEAIGTIRNDDSLFPVSNQGYMSASSYPGKTLVWSDEFDGGPINLSNWTYDLGANGWGNQELQNYTSNSENSYVDDGHLFIVARDEGTHYTSARMKSIGLQEFQYGRIDVRAILPKGQGIWPAIWMLGANFPTSVGQRAARSTSWSSSAAHRTPSTAPSTTERIGPNTTTRATARAFPWTETFSDEFHVFSIDWDRKRHHLAARRPAVLHGRQHRHGKPTLPVRQPLLLHHEHRRGRPMARLSRRPPPNSRSSWPWTTSACSSEPRGPQSSIHVDWRIQPEVGVNESMVGGDAS